MLREPVITSPNTQPCNVSTRYCIAAELLPGYTADNQRTSAVHEYVQPNSIKALIQTHARCPAAVAPHSNVYCLLWRGLLSTYQLQLAQLAAIRSQHHLNSSLSQYQFDVHLLVLQASHAHTTHAGGAAT